MDGVFSTNHKALDLIALDLIPVSYWENHAMSYVPRCYVEEDIF